MCQGMYFTAIAEVTLAGTAVEGCVVTIGLLAQTIAITLRRCTTHPNFGLYVSFWNFFGKIKNGSSSTVLIYAIKCLNLFKIQINFKIN